MALAAQEQPAPAVDDVVLETTLETIVVALTIGVSGDRLYLYALAAAGRPGVERAVGLLDAEVRRGMQLMGVSRVDQLTPDKLRRR